MSGGPGERFFDDFRVGEVFATASVTLTEADILGFARRYDPQPFHTDPEAARRSPFGGLVASGFHTLAAAFRLFLDTGAIAACSLGSPGLEDLRWLRPVRPGDALRVEAEVAKMRPSASRPGQGVLIMDYRAFNQRGEAVLTFRAVHLLRRRPGGGKEAPPSGEGG